LNRGVGWMIEGMIVLDNDVVFTLANIRMDF
jgi:hypothetical protein